MGHYWSQDEIQWDNIDVYVLKIIKAYYDHSCPVKNNGLQIAKLRINKNTFIYFKYCYKCHHVVGSIPFSYTIQPVINTVQIQSINYTKQKKVDDDTVIWHSARTTDLPLTIEKYQSDHTKTKKLILMIDGMFQIAEANSFS